MAAFKQLLVIFVLIISVFGYDYKSYSTPRRTIDFKSLAKNLDRYFKLFAGSISQPKRNSFQPHPHSEETSEADEEDDDDMIGLRANFGNSQKDVRTPHEIMRDNREEPSVSPAQWQNMVAPFVPILPNIEEYCSCKGIGNCGCCIGFYIKPISMRNNVCVNVSMSRDPNTNSKMMAHVRTYFDTYKILDLSVSDKRPPTACVSIVPFSSLAACAQIGNFHIDKSENKGCLCASVMLQSDERSLTHSPYLCACFGGPYNDAQKRGPFGFDIKGILGAVKNFFVAN